MRDDGLYLSNILECIQRIESYVTEGKAAFMDNSMMQDAVIRNFEIIGEATKRLSETVKRDHAEIPWRQMAGFRDVLIHDYLSVDMNEVWSVIERDLPVIKPALLSLAQQFAESSE
ncbi:HepT-like ribonuclease domain-containing protein [Leptolyngbya iicbica]|uniref:DUF86 domain-containing protein n=2 Tax=Cyanophyceae TaxID=3028117 RepID=A0A4Q7EEA6_9CYAN|nr:DUF86 domain-containing protein [Leptolyngbya sp. LK]RZM82144.1 DUF86 domain-containing protein [Leptolyngbya sp. LK]